MCLLHNSGDHQDFDLAHVRPHISYAQFSNCFLYTGKHCNWLGHFYHMRQRIPMYPNRQSMESESTRNLHQSQRLIYWECRSKYCYGHCYSLTPGACCMGSPCKPHASIVGHCGVSSGQLVSSLLSIKLPCLSSPMVRNAC